MASDKSSGESIAYRVIIASVLGPVVAIPLCVVRLYTKRYILRNTGYDDCKQLVTPKKTTNGLGKHRWDVSDYHFNKLMKRSKHLYASSICAFSISRSFRCIVYIVMAICVLYSVPAAFGFLWVCQPIAKYWDFSITTGSCIDLNAFFLATACINAATDLALLVLPLFIIKDLRLPMKRKIGPALLLMTGSFVCVVSLIRVHAVVRDMHKIATDGTWAMVMNFIWILVEMWMGIICTCLPTTHTFVKKYFCAPVPTPTPGVQNVNWVALEVGSNRSPMKDSRDRTSESKNHDHDFATFRSIECDERALASASSCDGESRRSLDSRV
ncbi:conserved hypothetical protein [Pyrenophora tritici-repentis Pt-1C-BFP]|uniref:Rhodopsin domain-containing protein n=1 Tax=Pyrenophora tritici-repentis (strain Pt-1C-BFP) TaxID=426418 RepID=B2W3U9_PYRTR|nr:uncharacterized protein PTRG_05149 [Pyrenophora tritici-repentis Pt-1C-BFP]EDU48056.1 conserved hypothetical protein [Pyrenophora tritici-repentis Pt-1C-BFP]